MNCPISDVDRRVLTVLQGGFPRSQTPYKHMAERAGISPTELLAALENWKREGKLRRIGSIVDHFKVGLSGGAMVVWRVEPGHIEQVGTMLAGFKEVSHAYEREVAASWPFNLYTMVHGTDTEQVEQAVERMSRACGVSDYRILKTEKELKKVPPTYFPDPDSDGAQAKEE
ncbi:MAG: siroheme decarboxylase subunit beta [Planctomycetota bacterium]|jgi:DNA-binding Lrp family transcriptional regulator